MQIAEIKPNLPISSAIFCNFCCNGVPSVYSWARRALILPIHEQSPTTITNNFPYPVRTLVPPIKIGEGTSCLSVAFFYPFFSSSSFFLMQTYKIFLWIGSIYPVIALSSVVISLASNKRPSAGISMPSETWTTSPTNTKSWWIYLSSPYLRTVTLFLSSTTEFNFINYLSFW